VYGASLELRRLRETDYWEKNLSQSHSTHPPSIPHGLAWDCDVRRWLVPDDVALGTSQQPFIQLVHLAANRLTTRQCGRHVDPSSPSHTVCGPGNPVKCAAGSSPNCSHRTCRRIRHSDGYPARCCGWTPFPCCAYCWSTASPLPKRVSVNTCYCLVHGLFNEMAYMELQKRMSVWVRRERTEVTDWSCSCLLCGTLQPNIELSTDGQTDQ